MISIYAVIAIVVIHWIADFVLQSHEDAVNKSHSPKHLLRHVAIYFSCWYIVLLVIAVAGRHFNGPSLEDLGWTPYMGLFPIITFFFHFITDFFTSKLNANLYAKGDTHNFFVSVGFDQVLHYIQLFLTYYLLSK